MPFLRAHRIMGVVNELRAFRRSIGLSQKQFATRLGVPVETLRTWDSGRRPGPAPVLRRAHALAREPIGFRIPGCGFTTFLVKPHNHPSRFLSNLQIDELGRACQWLIHEVD